MKRTIAIIFSLFLTACPSEKTQDSFQDDLKNTTNSVKNKLNEIDKKAQEKVDQAADKVKDASEDLGNKVDKGIENMEKKTKEVVGN